MTWLIEELLAVVLRGEHVERALRRRHAAAAERLARASRALDVAEARLRAHIDATSASSPSDDRIASGPPSATP